MAEVSVIVAVYNVEKYLKKCLDSLVNQTLKDIEIIAVNDGSTDNSRMILSEYEKKYDNLKVYDKQNGGLSDARNFGMKYATGKYIAFLDSDDYVDNTLYEKMYNLAIKDDCDLVDCDFIWEYPNKKKIDTSTPYSNTKEMIKSARVVAWNKLIKKEILDTYNLIFPKGLYYEDIEFSYKLFAYINKVSFLKEPLIHYIQRNNSISNNQSIRTLEVFNVLDNVISYYKKHDLYEKYEDYLIYSYTRIVLCSSLLRMVKIKDKKLRKKVVKYSWKKLNQTFPNWKKNPLLNDLSFKNLYMKFLNKYNFHLIWKLLALKP